MLGLSRRLVLLCALALLATFAAMAVVPDRAAAVDSRITNAAIYAKANSFAEGAYGGQCIVWVQNVFKGVAVAAGSPARIGYTSTFGYHDCFKVAGGVEVSATSARRGDIIQLFVASDPFQARVRIHPQSLWTTLVARSSM